MVERRAKVLVGAVLVLAVVQILVEDVLVFLGATGDGPLQSRFVMLAIPLVLALLLAALTILPALASDWQR